MDLCFFGYLFIFIWWFQAVAFYRLSSFHIEFFSLLVGFPTSSTWLRDCAFSPFCFPLNYSWLRVIVNIIVLFLLSVSSKLDLLVYLFFYLMYRTDRYIILYSISSYRYVILYLTLPYVKILLNLFFDCITCGTRARWLLSLWHWPRWPFLKNRQMFQWKKEKEWLRIARYIWAAIQNTKFPPLQ